jgi:hypothetical protein
VSRSRTSRLLVQMKLPLKRAELTSGIEAF